MQSFPIGNVGAGGRDFVTLLPAVFGAGRASVLLDEDLPKRGILVLYS